MRTGAGFDLHPHSDFEILSYVVAGRLTNADSMGNRHTLSRGEVQYMSAGTGVWHSEHNRGDETLRFLQIWVFPDEKGHEPAYGDHRFAWKEREDRWLYFAAGRQAYLLQVEGSSSVGGVGLDERDALEIVAEDVVVKAATTSHVFVMEMAKVVR